ncbi:hypothetical protein FOA52_002271 [Chlamydomonas sp. UWO 241]|nr:hypothetical protein FOA52_002271 [Chlamydomonas sp. UWO 241]
MLLALAPRNVNGEINYHSLLDAVLSEEEVDELGPTLGATTARTARIGSPVIPEFYAWDSDAPLAVSLRLHATSDPYDVPAGAMRRYAAQLTLIRKRENHGEKVLDLMRHFLLGDMLINAGSPCQPDLSFRQWLMYSGVLARTMDRDDRGIVAPEVYEVFDQIVAALGLPPVSSAVMISTEMGASLRHTTRIGATPP